MCLLGAIRLYNDFENFLILTKLLKNKQNTGAD